jgi:glutathione S-transferase
LLKIPLQTRWVSIFDGESHTPEFLRRNPAGAVPALELDDGRSVAESNAILCYLARDTALLPSDPYLHAKTLQWLFFEQDYIQPTIATLRHWMLTGKAERRAKEELERRRRGGEHALDVLDRALTGESWLVDGVFTIADIAMYSYVHRAEDARFTLATRPALTAWCARLHAEHGPLPEVIPYSADPLSHREL